MSYRIHTKILKENLLNGLNWDSLKKSGSVLGGGAFSQVIEYSNPETNELYAVKVMPYMKEEKQKINQEIEILQKIGDHPEMQNFCANYHGYVKYAEIKRREEEKTTRKFIAIVFELADGNLEEFLARRTNEKKEQQGLLFEELKDLIRTIGDGMLKLQSLNIAHRDIKPINILYFKRQGNIIQFKLTDFGEVKFDADADAEATIKGTPKYLAPEINYELMHDLAKSKNDVFKADVYSMGLTIIFSILLKGPFDGVNKKKCIRKDEFKLNPRENNEGPYDMKIKGLIEEICEKFKTEPKIMQLKTLLEKCLQYNPTNRIDWEEFKVFALDLFVEQKIVAPPEEIKMECNICDQKEKKIKQFEKIVDQKDIFIKILLERNSKLVHLLDAERIKRETAENNLKEILDNQRTPEKQKKFENIENSEEKSENSLKKEIDNKNLMDANLHGIFNVLPEYEESKEEQKKNINDEFEKIMMSHLMDNFPKNEKKENFEVRKHKQLNKLIKEGKTRDIQILTFNCKVYTLKNDTIFIRYFENASVFEKFTRLRELEINFINSFVEKQNFFELFESLKQITTLKILNLAYYNDSTEDSSLRILPYTSENENIFLNSGDLRMLFESNIQFFCGLIELSLDFQYNSFTSEGIIENIALRMMEYNEDRSLIKFKLNISNRLGSRLSNEHLEPAKAMKDCVEIDFWSADEKKQIKNSMIEFCNFDSFYLIA